MQSIVINGYQVAGNAYVAIAIAVLNPRDTHYFIGDEADSAFDRAVTWTSWYLIS